MPVIRNTADTGLADLLCRLAADFFSFKINATALCFQKPKDCLRQLGLTVSFNTRNTQHFTRTDRERYIVHDFYIVKTQNIHIFNIQHYIAANRVWRSATTADRLTHHHLGKFGNIRFLRRGHTNNLTRTNNRHAVCNLVYFAQFVGDEDNGLAHFFQSSQDLKQCIGFLRCQKRCRFVQNQDIRFAVKQLNDFNALTLTYGKLEVSDVLSFASDLAEEKLLYLAASAEAKSEHPLGKAIVAYAKKRDLPLSESAAFRMTSGKGISAEADGCQLLCGNEKYLHECGVSVTANAAGTLEKLRLQGKASILVAVNGQCVGVIALSDVLRPEAAAMVQKLTAMQTNTVLLTGDNQKTADYFATQVGIREVYADLLPEDKVGNIAALQQRGRNVCMIGDGVNDAPALKTASVGVAMGSMGSDIAVEAADIALMSDDISKIPYLKRLSNATVKTIKLSITLSMCINFLAVTLSVLGLLNPTTGALVHNAGSCFVVLIAALLYDRKFE